MENFTVCFVCNYHNVCLGQLLVDEFNESDKRKMAMDKKIAELRKKYAFLPSKLILSKLSCTFA